MFIFSFFYYQLSLFQWLESTNNFLHISGDSKDSQKTWKVPLKWSRDKLESKSRALTFACETVIYDIKLACVTSNNSKQNDILPCRTVFKQLKVRKTTPIPKEMRPINNGKVNNTREPLHINGRHEFEPSKQFYSWLDLENVGGSDRCLV